MIVLDPPGTHAALDVPARQAQASPSPSRVTKTNVGNAERTTSLVAGTVLAALGLSRRSLPGLLVAGIGGALLHRGASGQCAVYRALGVDTANVRSADEEVAARGIHVQQSFLINRSAAELYAFWRDFANLPRFMSHLERVDVLDQRRSHWVTKAPKVAGGSIEWDAEITADEPNRRIAWRSLPGSQTANVGEIRFAPALGDRGTEVRVSMDYVPPAGRLGHWVAKLFGESPSRQIRDDLRNFKRLMELGEIPTTTGQPRGTCLGHGKHEHY